MATTALDGNRNGAFDHVVRPRPRKPVHSQLSHISNASSQGDEATAVGTPTSGRSTPVPHDAPPSVKVLSSARKNAREQRRRLFPTTQFESRVSHFDPNSDYRDFHGFFNLFWIGLAIMGITTMLRNYKETGYPLRIQIWSLFTVKLWHLALADFAMVASSAVSLPLQRMFRSKTGMTWANGGMAFVSIYQAVWLAVWVAAPFVLEWTWTSQVFLLLHTMVLLMKMHSYNFYNGHLSETERRLHALDNPSTADKAPAYLYPSVENPQGTVAAVATPEKKGKKSKRKNKTNGNGNGNSNNSAKEVAQDVVQNMATNDSDTDDEVSVLREILAEELTSPMGNTTYPRNLTLPNFIDYLFCPTLCYELEYPRTSKIDWKNLISKIIAVFGCIFLMTLTSEEFVLPVLVESNTRITAAVSPAERLLVLAEAISWMLFPFMLIFLLVFLVIFEYVLGAFAELTCFGDRHFYSDWWNSTDWMEFSREWNVPVYSFLRRHVYSASRPHIGRSYAMVITFLISALGHEIVMACITKKLRGYGFVCQMMQLPIVAVQRTKFVRGRKTLNNVMFWCSMILGLSLICSLYVLV